jgi:hypothetical protein
LCTLDVEVSIKNLGRRPIYVSHVHLGVRGKPNLSLINEQFFLGKTLLEGDPPWMLQIPQNGLEEHANDWDKIRAVVIDSVRLPYHFCSNNDFNK